MQIRNSAVRGDAAESTAQRPAAAGFGTGSALDRHLARIAQVDGVELAQYLQEDVAQTLCAIKVRLEGLAQQDRLRGEQLASSIEAIRCAIRQLSSIAVEIRSARAPAPESAAAIDPVCGTVNTASSARNAHL